MNRILSIDGLNGEFLELSDVTPPDQPADLKPRWHLQAESPLAGDGEFTLALELWECEPAQLQLFLAQLVEAQVHYGGTCFLATGSYPDVSLEIACGDGTAPLVVAIEVWDADQKLDMRFSADPEQIEPAIAQLQHFVGR